MRPRFIRLLAVVIALVVPLQGMAVVAAGQCMAFGHHDASAGQDHDHAAHTHADGTDASALSDGDGDGDGDDRDAHCAPCTACCASASITGPAGLAILSSASPATYLFRQFPPIGVQPDGLDRPPLAL